MKRGCQIILLTIFYIFTFPKNIWALNKCPDGLITFDETINSGENITFTINGNKLQPDNYQIEFGVDGFIVKNPKLSFVVNSNSNIITMSTADIDNENDRIKATSIVDENRKEKSVSVKINKSGVGYCIAGSYKIMGTASIEPTCTFNYTISNSVNNPKCVDQNTSVIISGQNITYRGSPVSGQAELTFSNGYCSVEYESCNGKININLTNGNFSNQTYKPNNMGFGDSLYVTLIQYDYSNPSQNPTPVKFSCAKQLARDIQTKCTANDDNVLNPDDLEDGESIDVSQYKCDSNNDGKGDGFLTTIGCIPTDTTPFIGWLLKWGISIGSGAAFLLMAFAALKLTTSKGNPEAVKDGREMFVSAGAGLLLIILSMFLLRLIGVEILKIPGFN